MEKLPDEIIQNIQSFLFTKEEARTILVSKSWFRAWSTRPFLNFDSFEFTHRNSDALINLIDTTLDSHVEQGLAIVKLRLNVDIIQQRWLQLARQCNVIQLHLIYADQKWEPNFWREIFMTRSLQSLKVYTRRCKLVLSHTDIMCCNLNTFDLSWVYIDYLTFLNIMSLCPLIKKLMLHRCELVNCSNSGDFARGEFASLKTLWLVDIGINDEQLRTILSKTPKLEDLNLSYCYKLVKPINLSSASLKRVRIVKLSAKIIRIDAPNLGRLAYLLDCHGTTPFPIVTPAKKGEVNLDIVYHDRDIDASWFHGLRDFLAKFAKSNVKIRSSFKTLRCNFNAIRATPLPHRHQFETLTLRDCFPNLPLFDAFVTILHPKTVIFEGPETVSNTESLTNIGKLLSHGGNLLCCKLDRNKCWRYYIKDVKLYHVVEKEQKPLDIYVVRMGSKAQMVISLAFEWGGVFALISICLCLNLA